MLSGLGAAALLWSAVGCGNEALRGPAPPAPPLSRSATQPFSWRAKGTWGLGLGGLFPEKKDPINTSVMADVNYTYEFTRNLALEAKLAGFAADMQYPVPGGAAAGLGLGTIQIGSEFPRQGGRWYLGGGAGGAWLTGKTFGRDSDWAVQGVLGLEVYGRRRMQWMNVGLEGGYLRLMESERGFTFVRLALTFNF